MKVIDANEVTNNYELETDVCVVGTGAAGITLANELNNCSFKVCLLEGGGLSFDEDTQALYEFENVGQPFRPDNVPRLRYFGGTTNSWFGRCVLLDKMDLECREWVKDSGWPIDYAELMPYYDRALKTLEVPFPDKIHIDSWKHDLTYQTFCRDEVRPAVNLWATAKEMGSAYLPKLEGSSNINIFINANVTELETSDNLSITERLHVRCLSGNSFFVKAKVYILACGGLENARLLLVSRKHNSAGLGNQFDVVGRYYMDHPKSAECGVVFLNKENFNIPLYRGLTSYGMVEFFLALTEETQRREGLLNHCVSLKPKPRLLTMFAEKYHSVKSLRSGLRQRRLLFDATNFAHKKIRRQLLALDYLTVENQLEQGPNPDSRITLSQMHDRFGMNLLKLDWKIGSEEKRSLRRFHEILDRYLRRYGLGYLDSKLLKDESYWPQFNDTNHPTGATRMSDTPKTGVVDKNCQVYGANNLFITGSSVFPTGGFANPTLTIVALAIRLADHIKGQFEISYG